MVMTEKKEILEMASMVVTWWIVAFLRGGGQDINKGGQQTYTNEGAFAGDVCSYYYKNLCFDILKWNINLFGEEKT